MQFSVNKRDGPARIGELTIERKKITTPKIIFIDTKRFKAPEFADILITNEKQKTKKPSLKIYEKLLIQRDKENNHYYHVVSATNDSTNLKLREKTATIFIVANASQLFNQPKKFVEFIVKLREKTGYQKTIYLPSIANPTNIALLTYLGVDFFDSTSAIVNARKKTLFFETGLFKTDELEELPCNCPSCTNINKKPSEMSFQEILNHNYYAINAEIKHVRNAIVQENIRNLVEKRINTDPNLTAILRNLDRDHYEFLEARTPIYSKGKLIATSHESLNRPEIKRFQERIINRYKKPRSTKTLLLLPCSAKKPYSFSKTHRFFREKTQSLKNPYIVHEVIITSPIGLVPRELELTYPASAYDIPVTGHWDEDEKKMIRELLTKYLKTNKYDNIIIHLPTTIVEFIVDIAKNTENTCVDDKPTSKESLEKLFTVLKKTTDQYEKIKPSIRLRENMESTASYQFGRKNAEKLLKECYIKGRYPNHKIMYNNKQLGMITQQRGLISLTLDGAERITGYTDQWIEIYDDFSLKGSVFAPGVKDADKSIRIGDEVIVLKNSKLCAVGVAQMNGDEMKQSTHGEAVKIRHIK